MKRCNIKYLLGFALAAQGVCLAWGDSLFKDPIIHLTPRRIDFGTVPLKTTVTNTFVLQNWGGGKLIGKATVPRPFKIISGANYRLGPTDAQIITVIYTPSGAALDTNVVKFTGGAVVLAPLIGKAAHKPGESDK